jgi:hypothetical protein
MSTWQVEALKSYLEQIHIIFNRYSLINVIEEGHYPKKFADQVGHLRPQYNKNGQMDFQEEDLLLLVHETRFAIANTILLWETGLTPFILGRTDYGPFGQYFAKEVDTRFFFFVDDVFMRLYNFWNRIANFLNIFFQIEKNLENVYFASLMDKLFGRLQHDQAFGSLLKFKEAEYKDIINKRRRVVVHRESSSATYFISFLKSVGNLKNLKEPLKLQEELSGLQKERDELPQFFVAQYQRMIQGTDEMLAIIKDNVK